jgi:hypothetical protein
VWPTAEAGLVLASLERHDLEQLAGRLLFVFERQAAETDERLHRQLLDLLGASS